MKRDSVRLALALTATMVGVFGLGAAAANVAELVLVGKAYEGVPLTVKARLDETGLGTGGNPSARAGASAVVGTNAVPVVELFFRLKGQADFRHIAMTPVPSEAGSYRATIPGSRLKTGDLEVYATVDGVKSGAPAAAPVIADRSAPRAYLMKPAKDKASIMAEHSLIIVGLNDDAANVDTKSVKVLWDKVDVTAKCTLAPTAVSMVLTEAITPGWHTLTVSAADTAGNVGKPETWRFKAKSIEETTLKTYRRVAYDGNYDKEGEAEDTFENDFGAEVGLKYGSFGAGVVLRTDDPLFTRKPGQPTSKLSVGWQSGLGVDPSDGYLILVDSTVMQSTLTLDNTAVRGASVMLPLGPVRLGTTYGLNKVAVAGALGDYERQVLGFVSGVQLKSKLLGSFGTYLNVAAVADKPDASLGIDSGMKKPKATVAASGSAVYKSPREGLLNASTEVAISATSEGYSESMVPSSFFPIPDVLEALPKLDSAMVTMVETNLGPARLKGTYRVIGFSYESLGSSVTPDHEGYTVEGDLRLLGGQVELTGRTERDSRNVQGPVSIPKVANWVIARLPSVSASTKETLNSLLGDGSAVWDPGDLTLRNEMGVAFDMGSLPAISLRAAQETTTNPVVGQAKDLVNTGVEVTVGPLKWGGKPARATAGLGPVGPKLEVVLLGAQTSSRDNLNHVVDEGALEGGVKAKLTLGMLEFASRGSYAATTQTKGTATRGDDVAVREPAGELSVTAKPTERLSITVGTKLAAQSASDGSLDNNKLTLNAKVGYKVLDGIILTVGAERVSYKDAVNPSTAVGALKVGFGIKGEW